MIVSEKEKHMILFFDGCHKIYYCADSDKGTIRKMRGWGYEPFRGNALVMQELWENSCGLRFIQHADFDDNAPQLYQFDERENVTDFAKEVFDFLGRNA